MPGRRHLSSSHREFLWSALCKPRVPERKPRIKEKHFLTCILYDGVYIYTHYIHTWVGRGRKPAAVKNIDMVMEGECESSGELHLFPITSSPAMPILYVNSHSTWGALLRLVSRPLHHKKRAPPSNRCILFPPCSQ